MNEKLKADFERLGIEILTKNTMGNKKWFARLTFQFFGETNKVFGVDPVSEDQAIFRAASKLPKIVKDYIKNNV